MFLSNPRKSFLLTVFFALAFQACGSSSSNVNSPVSLNGDNKSEFPFSTKEPEVYHGDLVVSSHGHEEHYFIARKGEKWRFDFATANRSSICSETGVVISVDHKRKTFEQTSERQIPTVDANFFNDLTSNFFKGKEYREFEEVGRDGSQVKYKVKETKYSKESLVVTVDTQSGMIVRQEFTETSAESGKPISFVYEIRDLKFDVDESVFQIPLGYRKVTRDNTPQNKVPLASNR